MRKTIDIGKEELIKIEEYQQKNGIKSFSETIRSIIREYFSNDASADISDTNFALLADAIKELDRKMNILTSHMPPKSAGEV